MRSDHGVTRFNAMSFYVTGGTLQSDAPSYVEREADRQIYEGLLEGEFCYVLTARQMGKSSLMVRTANRLRAAGIRVVALDLTALGGQNITPEQWYFGLLDTLGQELGLAEEVETFWQSNETLGPLHRFMKFIRQILLPRLQKSADKIKIQPEPADPVPSSREGAHQPAEGQDSASSPPEATQPGTEGPQRGLLNRQGQAEGRHGGDALISSKVRLVIFVDEIDFVRSLPFSTDEFFAAIRECYNHRTLDPAYELVTFCLLGVASPSDLIRDTRTTPFNIGRRIELNDFTSEEALPLMQGLDEATRDYRNSKPLLDRILYWTEGHPYLTQRLCRTTAEALRGTGTKTTSPDESPRALVDRLCADLFFSARARERDDNLIFVRERLVRSEADLASLLDLYLKVWKRKRVTDDELDPLISLLRLSGVVRVSGGRLRERNPVYYRVFDREWVRSNMPEAELRRQREAYRRGVIWATSVSAVVVLSLAILSLLAVKKTSEAYLAQAKASSASGQIGQRVKSLAAIQQAKRWGILFHDLAELRDEAIAALNLVDLEERPAIVSSGDDVTAPELNGTFSRYAVADRDGRIRIVGIGPNEVELELAPTGVPVRWLRFSSADTYLGVGYGNEVGGEQRFVLWRVTDKSRIVELAGDIARDGWDVSPNGDRLAVGLTQQSIRIYSLPGGELRPETVPEVAQTGARRVTCLRFDPTGKRLADCSRASLYVYVWNFGEKQIESHSHSVGVVDLDWHPNGRQLVTACENGDIYLVDLPSRMKDRLYSASAKLVEPGVCFNRMGTVLATVCSDLSLRLWRPQNRRQILSSFNVDEGEPATLRFSTDNRWLSLTTRSNRVRVLKVEGGRELVTFQGEPDTTDAFQSIGFDPQGRVLIAAGPRVGIWFWDTADPRKVERIHVGGLISTVEFDRHGTALLASTTGGFFQWPFQSLQHPGEEELHFGPAQCLAFRGGLLRFALTTNGAAAVVHAGADADHIDLFAVRDPDASSRWVADRKLGAIAITPDGRWLFASATEEREILVWDLFERKGGKPCQRLPGSRHMSLSPSGKWLITAWAGDYQFRKVGSWRMSQLKIPQSHRFERFTPVAFASLPGPGECLLALASSPTTVQLFRFWDQDSPKIEKLAQLESPDRLPVVSLAFDPTCSRLAAASEAQIVQVWNLAQIREELRQRGLAAGFPEFRPVSSANLRFVFEPSTENEGDKAAARVQEEWLTRINNLTERIETATSDGGQSPFSDLVQRGRAFRFLGRLEMALRDLNKALELRPDDPEARNEKTRIEQELELKRQSRSAAGAGADAKVP